MSTHIIAIALPSHYHRITIVHNVNTGMNDTMDNVMTIAKKKNMTNKQIHSESWTPTITIPAGQTLHVRILPWHKFNAVKSGNYIALRNVVIEGMVFSEESESGLIENAEQATAEKRMVNG